MENIQVDSGGGISMVVKVWGLVAGAVSAVARPDWDAYFGRPGDVEDSVPTHTGPPKDLEKMAKAGVGRSPLLPVVLRVLCLAVPE